MGHLPNFDNTKVYALMNGTDGKFLQYDLNDGSIGVADYEDDTTSEWKTNFYEVEVVDQDPLTIVLTTRLSLFADVGIEALSLNGSHDNVEFTEKKAGTHKKQQWVISTHKSGSGAHDDFFRVKKVHTSTYLWRHLDTEEITGSNHQDHIRGLWRFVELPDLLKEQMDNILGGVVQQFRYAKRAEREHNDGQQPGLTPWEAAQSNSWMEYQQRMYAMGGVPTIDGYRQEGMDRARQQLYGSG